MLEMLDAYLWSKKRHELLPQVSLSLSRGSALPEDLGHVQPEDAQTHWGLRLPGGLEEECRACRFPLSQVVAKDEKGITFYRCGCAFHYACLKSEMRTSTELSCPLCMY
jgi:hypothetical protein